MIDEKMRKKLQAHIDSRCVGLNRMTADTLQTGFHEGISALDRMLSTESAEPSGCIAGCKSFTGGEIRHHKDCAHYPESFSKMYDELETRIQSESVSTETQSDFEAATEHSLVKDVEGSSEAYVDEDKFESFLAGVSFATQKHRPLVEEMLTYFEQCVEISGPSPSSLIARAERLLGTKEGAKDGKEE